MLQITVDVVYALAHATGKTGRFTLIEKWRNSERLLAPHEHPLKILLKWGEYSSDVQFILQRTALEPRQETKSDVKFAQGQQIYGRTPTLDSHSSTTQTHNIIQKSSVMATGDNSLLRPAPNSPLQSRDIKKSLTFSGGHSSHLTAQATNENVSSSSEVGAMQGFIPQSISSPQQYPSPVLFEQSSLGSSAQSFSNRPYYKTSAPRFSSSLTRPPAPPPYELVKGNPPPPTACFRNQPLNTYGCYTSKERCSPSMFGRSPPLYASRAPIPMVGNRHPRELPPYRDPPPPPPPSHPALMKISPQGKANSQTYSSFVPDSSSVRHYMTSDSSSPNPNTCYPESSANHDGIEYNLTSSKDQIPLKLVSSIEDDIASKNVYSSGDKVKKDIKKNACETSSISSVNNHNNSSPSKRTGYNSNTSMGKQTSPMKKSTTFNNNNNKDTINSVSGDINENMIGSLSSSVEKNNRNQVSGSPLPNNMHKGSPMKGKDGERSYVKDMIKQLVNDSNKDSSHGNLEQKSEQVVVDNYYRELVRLVNQQRDKISAQLIDLTKYEAEIAFTEGYCKEEESRLNYIKAEIQRLENVTSDSPDSSSPVKYSMEELEEQLRVAQASENKTIEDIANIKIKMSTYDQQLSPMKNKICTLQEALDQEESFHERVHGEEQGAIMREIEKLQSAINQSTNQADFTQDVSQQLSQELHEADNRLTEKKNEIEKLKEAMREANMEALVMTPVEELKAPNDKTGTAKNGTSRRMKGSPRQLETAVPTSKNPHGVWV